MEDQIKKRLKNKTKRLKKPTVVKLAKHFDISSQSKKTKTELASELMEHFPKEISNFFQDFALIKKTTFNRLMGILPEMYPEYIDEIKELENPAQILLFLYRIEDEINLEEIVHRCGILENKTTNKYQLNSEEDLSISEIFQKVQNFVENWNSNNVWKINAKCIKRSEGVIEEIFYVETGRKQLTQFKFRTDEISTEKDKLDTESESVYPVEKKTFEISEEGNKEYIFVPNFNPERTRKWFEEFLSFAFGEFSLNTANKEKIEKTTKHMKELLSDNPDLDTAEEAISGRKTKVIGKVKNSDLPSDKKDKITEEVDKINYGGPRLKDEVRGDIYDFVCRANYEEMEKIVNTRTVEDVLDKIPEAREKFFLSVGEKHKPVLVENGGKHPQSRLSEDEDIALNCFLGEEDAIKTIEESSN